MSISNAFPIVRRFTNMFFICKHAIANCRNPPGHFYSPVVNVKEVLKNENRIWGSDRSVHSIPLDIEGQFNLLRQFQQYYDELPFPENASEGFRYYLNNAYYSFTDGIILYCFLRHFKPRRVIEIGSGFSSALMLDTCEKFGLNTKLSFIEPFPKRLHSLLTAEDKIRNEIIVDKLQNVPLSFFSELVEGDILFIDSTHVCKTGSDVNYILFEILPLLHQGVIIHIHDIFDSFEYPKEWITQKRSWNEIYLLRAFLMNNPAYTILLFSHFIHSKYPTAFKGMPLCYRNKGSNFWLRKN
jgi:predicted O-methyltransferase YrrM